MGITNVLSKYAGDQCLDEGADATANQLFDITPFVFNKTAADGAAATTTADTLFWTNPYDCNVVLISARFVTIGAGIVGDAANIATIQLKTDNGAGGATAVGLAVSTLTTDGGTFVSNIGKGFTTRTPASCILVPGANLFFAITKGGTGVIVPISLVAPRLRKVS